MDYNFEVEKKAVQVCGGQKIPNINAIIRKDTGQVLSTVSNRYQLFTHNEVVESFESALDISGNEFKNRRVDTFLPSNGAKMFRKYTFPDIRINIGKDYVTKKDDEVELTLELRNSYDGSLRIGFTYGAYRLVCSNGLVIGQLFSSLTKKHYQSLQLNDIVNEFQNCPDILKRQASLWESWKEIPMTFNEASGIFENIYAPKKTKDRILERFEIEEPTKYGLYQAVTWDITHNTKARNPMNIRSNQVFMEDNFSKVFYN